MTALAGDRANGALWLVVGDTVAALRIAGIAMWEGVRVWLGDRSDDGC